MDYMKVYEEWCNNAYFDEATRAELKAIAGDEAEIKDRFYRELEFGTAGLRGVIGAGTNRILLLMKAVRARVLPLLMTPEICLRSLRKLPHFAFVQTVLRVIYSIPYVRHRSFLLRCGSLAVLRVL